MVAPSFLRRFQILAMARRWACWSRETSARAECADDVSGKRFFFPPPTAPRVHPLCPLAF